MWISSFHAFKNSLEQLCSGTIGSAGPGRVTFWGLGKGAELEGTELGVDMGNDIGNEDNNEILTT